MKHFKPLAIAMLASQLLAVTQVADAAHGAAASFSNGASNTYLQTAFSNLRTNRIALYHVYGGTIRPTAEVTAATAGAFTQLLSATLVGDSIGLSSAAVVENRAAVVFALSPELDAITGPQVSYVGADDTFVVLGIFNTNGTVFYPTDALASGRLTSVGYPEITANAGATAYSAESLFGAQATAVPKPGVGAITVGASQIEYFAVAVCYKLNPLGQPTPVAIGPDQLQFTDWTVATQ